MLIVDFLKLVFLAFYYGVINIPVDLQQSKLLKIINYLNIFYWFRFKQDPGIRINAYLESMGPMFIKFGQLLSTRTDVVPLHIGKHLQQLTEQCSPFSGYKAKKIIEKLSTSESRVLITGPTGSGKELVARKIHKNSLRSKEPFIIINAALLKESAYEKELFGEEFEDGNISFGSLERANRGTLLIDEVSEVPFETQANVLRVLIDQKFKRINSTHDIKVDVRIICTNSKDVLQEIKFGNFREDLFHRLNVFNIEIEPLNKRIEDIPLLIEYFIENICETYNYKKFKIKDDNYLLNYDWPGNVRELRNLIERIAILSPGNDEEKILNIIKESLSKSANETFSVADNLSIPLREARENFEKEYLISQIKKFGGNISKTAKFVGMERSALHRKLKGLGVKDLN